MRKKTLVSTAAALLLGVTMTTASAGDYAAIAAGTGGYGWVEGGYGSMEGARSAARRACVRSGYGACDKTVAERSSWYFAGGSCDGYTYVGTSPQSQWRANQIVAMKAARDGNYNCMIEVRF